MSLKGLNYQPKGFNFLQGPSFATNHNMMTFRVTKIHSRMHLAGISNGNQHMHRLLIVTNK